MQVVPSVSCDAPCAGPRVTTDQPWPGWCEVSGVHRDQSVPGAGQSCPELHRMDVSKCTVKLDHSVGSPEPATNWRQAVGFPVYGVGQPTEEGFVKITEKLNSKEKVGT